MPSTERRPPATSRTRSATWVVVATAVGRPPDAGSSAQPAIGASTATAAARARSLGIPLDATENRAHYSHGRLPRLMDTLELTALCAWCFAVALAGGVVGLVFGTLRLPAVLLVASHPAAGAGANIGISGVAATAAAIVHVRAGRINWRLFAWMAPPSMLGAVAGGYLSGVLPDTALLVTIGAVLVYFGIDLLRDRERPSRNSSARGEDLDIRAAIL